MKNIKVALEGPMYTLEPYVQLSAMWINLHSCFYIWQSVSVDELLKTDEDDNFDIDPTVEGDRGNQHSSEYAYYW